jgi:tetratricopeptide (TPR) repeat protein
MKASRIISLNDGTFRAEYEKIYSPKSQMNFDPKITESQLNVFYDFALEEYRNANFGSARDLLEGITQKTDSHPMSWYFLGEIYKNIYPYSQETAKFKIVLLNITKSNLNNGLKQSAYDELARIEKDFDVAISYGQKAVAIEDNMFSKYILLTAYYNAYNKTGNKKYKEGFTRTYDPKMKNLFGDTKLKFWTSEVFAKK